MQWKPIRGRRRLNIRILIRRVLFIEILARRVALDNADCYGTSDCSTGYTKNCISSCDKRATEVTGCRSLLF